MSKKQHTKEAQIKPFRDHDAAGRLLSVAHRDRASAVLGSESLRYDAAGRRSSRIREDGAADFFRYDPAGQVTAAAYGLAASADPVAFPASQTFAYDAAGNRTQAVDGSLTASYQANAVNQHSRILVGAAETIPSFDALGNLLEDDRAAYSWDADIHLLSVAPKDGSVSAAYRYDALHRRVARLEGSAALTYFVHDGWNVVAEYAGSPGSSALAHEVRHVWGEDLGGGLQTAGGVGGLLASVRASGANWAHYDGNGNVVLLTDGTGAASARYAYDAFGKLKSSSGPAAEANRYRFSTKPQERAAALSYYGYRYYAPALGRWLSRDSLEEEGGVNLYRMVNNNPITLIDNRGLDPLTPEQVNLAKALGPGGTPFSGMNHEFLKNAALEDLQALQNAARAGMDKATRVKDPVNAAKALATQRCRFMAETRAIREQTDLKTALLGTGGAAGAYATATAIGTAEVGTAIAAIGGGTVTVLGVSAFGTGVIVGNVINMIPTGGGSTLGTEMYKAGEALGNLIY